MKSWPQNLGWLRQQAANSVPGQQRKTLLEVLGKERLVIEQHRGIQCYGTEEILVRASFGQIHITGNGLVLCCMSREQLCITGTIDKVELLGRSGCGHME